MVVETDSEHPQPVIDAATPGETVRFDSSVQYTLEESLVVTTPGLTLEGLNLRLADGADEDLIEVGADDIEISGFSLDGNRENQPGERQSNGILVTGATQVLIGKGQITAVSRHGVRIVDSSVGTSTAPEDTIHVDRGPVSDITVRDVRVDRPRRDGCSVEGPDLQGAVVENVRTFGSSDRGCIEVKDGAIDVYVGNCYAEDCVYGVAVQDHGKYPTANLRIVNNAAVGCETLVDAQTSHPPADVIVTGNSGRDLGGDGMGGPGGIHVNRIKGLVVADNVIHGIDGPGIAVNDCEEVSVNGNVVRDVEGPGIMCRGDARGTTDIILSNNRSAGGIELSGVVNHYLVTGNLLGAPIVDKAEGAGLLTDNLTKNDCSNPSTASKL